MRPHLDMSCGKKRQPNNGATNEEMSLLNSPGKTIALLDSLARNMIYI
jgi:hypothetical protein